MPSTTSASKMRYDEYQIAQRFRPRRRRVRCPGEGPGHSGNARECEDQLGPTFESRNAPTKDFDPKFLLLAAVHATAHSVRLLLFHCRADFRKLAASPARSDCKVGCLAPWALVLCSSAPRGRSRAPQAVMARTTFGILAAAAAVCVASAGTASLPIEQAVIFHRHGDR